MPRHNVEKLSKADAAAIANLYAEAWPKAYEYPEEWRRKRTISKGQVEKEMEEGYTYFGVRMDGKLVGVYKVKRVGEGLFAEHQAVHPDYRGQGLAVSMYEQLLKYAKEEGAKWVRVNILVGHAPSEKCVNKLCFKKVGELWEQAKGMLVQTWEREIT